jgi:hypothetical protein
VGQILLACEEPQEQLALLRVVVADRTAHARIAGFERVRDRALCGLTLDVEFHFAGSRARASAKVPGSWQRLDLNKKLDRKISNDGSRVVSGGQPIRPPARSQSKLHPARIERAGCHRVAQHVGVPF